MDAPSAATDAQLSLGSHLYQCWRQNRHVDIRLRFLLADDTALLVPAHKVVLERAAYFYALLSGPLAASTSTGEIVVRLDDPSITPDAVRAWYVALELRVRLTAARRKDGKSEAKPEDGSHTVLTRVAASPSCTLTGSTAVATRPTPRRLAASSAPSRVRRCSTARSSSGRASRPRRWC
jgi:hypothetical protein